MAEINSAFRESELIGRFYWDAGLTDELRINDAWIYIAMHEKRLRRAIRKGRLIPSSSFEVLVDGMQVEEPCSWLALQDWHRFKGHNHFGPFVVSIKLREIESRRFYVFKRRTNQWRRYYFVQREEKTPLFDTPAKRVNPLTLFNREPNGVRVPQSYTQYEVLLTESISLAQAKVEATSHTWCASNAEHCYAKLDRRKAHERLEGVLGCEIPRKKYMFPRPFPL